MSGAAFASGELNEPAERAELVVTARELVPLLRAHASETERLGTPAPDVVAALRAAGFYTLSAPRRYGGHEAGVRTAIEVFSELARGCGSSAWVVKIQCGGSHITSLFDDRARQDVWGEDRLAAVSVSTTGAPSNTGRRVPGGIIVDGDWSYASGIHHAQWALCKVPVDSGAAERPDAVLAMLPASDFTITDTWDMAGMQGSGSDGVSVRGVFVPEYRTLPMRKLLDATEVDGEGVYYTNVATMLAISIAGPVIGMAQGALDNVLETLAKGKAIDASVYTDAVRSPSVQLAVADVVSLIDTARLHAYRAARDIEAASVEGRWLDVAARARIRMDAGVVMLRCREAIERLLDIGGTSGFRRSNPVQRFWRDLSTVSRHAAVSSWLSREIYGRALLGIEEQVTEVV